MKSKICVFMVVMAVISASLVYGQSFNVSLKAFLEGPFSGTAMGTSLNSNNYLPLAQPYNTAPWNYTGTESVASIPNADVVDWVLVELRETAGDASTAYTDNIVATQAGFLLKNGNVVSPDGMSPLLFTGTVSYKLYAVVYHRNHLAVLSGNEILNMGGTYVYDFTTGAGQVYGGANGHKEVTPGVWAMTAGDGDANGQVNNADKNDVWKPQSGSSGYKAGDFSMNGQVDNIDKNDLWKINSGKSSQVIGSWSCGKAIADDRDGQMYSTRQIGNQCWMAENLNVGIRIEGNTGQTNNLIIEKYCYANTAANCDVYGGLYQWKEMMQYVTTPGAEGICPPAGGWHVPTDAEWCTIEQWVDPAIVCDNTNWRGVDGGGKLKEAGTAHWAPPNTGATNLSFFTALPGGRKPGGNFDDLTTDGYFWTSTESGSSAWRRQLNNSYATVHRQKLDKNTGFSVRCVNDVPNQPPSLPYDPSPPNGSTHQQLNTQLSWSCTDPENDPLTFDVYFGATNPPAIMSAGQVSNSYNPGSLSYGTTYFWKIIAHDDHSNTTEGPTWSFTVMHLTCGSPFIDSRDGQVYTTVQIGAQCWMGGNLNIGIMIQGVNNQTDNGQIEKYCFGNNLANCTDYGGLYQFNEMMNYAANPGGQGICPEEWHLPTDDEWCMLEQLIDPTIVCSGIEWRGTDGGGKLKEEGTAHWAFPNTGATNQSGFTALPAGQRTFYGNFNGQFLSADFWTSTGSGSSAWKRSLGYDSQQVSRDAENKSLGFSIRCMKLMTNQPPAMPSDPMPADSSAGVDIQDQLSWTCSDPENDPLTYDVYFGTTCPPAPVVTGQVEEVYDPGMICYDSTYYWKIVAHDDHTNLTEGPIWSFSVRAWECSLPFVDLRDGQVYTTVQIDKQCWMGENINAGTMIQGEIGQANNNILEKYCYENEPLTCDVYGGLYQWDEMMQYSTTPGAQGICPPTAGWHLPTDAEWCTLEQYVDPAITCSTTGWRGIDGGGKLKETGFAHWDPPNNGASNSSGFTALPGGYKHGPHNLYHQLTSHGFFWTSNLNGSNAWYRSLSSQNAMVERATSGTEEGYRVRCLTDIPNSPPDQPGNPWPPDGSVNKPITTYIHWTCIDKDNDPLTYDVYFGTTNPPGLVSAGQIYTGFHPDTLAYLTQYFWKIVAHDDHGHTTEGPVWNFRTLANQPPYPPFLPFPGNYAIDQPVNSHLAWSCNDPDNDPLTFDVFLGTSSIPPLVSSGQTNSTYYPTTLLPYTTYYWCIVAWDNSGHNTQGPLWSFGTGSYTAWQCGELLTDPRDNQTYTTVHVGNQCWMAENLNVGIMLDGNTPPANNGIIEKYCYDNNSANCDVYGGLYNWYEMMQYGYQQGTQGICPTEWHVPTDAEYTTLTATFGGDNAGGKLKETGYVHWTSPNTGATNQSGFTALPGGCSVTASAFFSLHTDGYFWSSSTEGNNALYRHLVYNSTYVDRSPVMKDFRYSVRCMKVVNQPPDLPFCVNPPDGSFGVQLMDNLEWSCNDPENDPLYFDVYLGYSFPLDLIGTTGDYILWPNLYPGMTYYWQIVAYDPYGNITEGPLWSFTTVSK